MSNKIEYVKLNYNTSVHLEELMYYMTWCDGQQFKKDLFTEGEFVDEYVRGKFREFQDKFPYFLHSLSDKYLIRFCVAVHNFYINEHKEINKNATNNKDKA